MIAEQARQRTAPHDADADPKADRAQDEQLEAQAAKARADKVQAYRDFGEGVIDQETHDIIRDELDAAIRTADAAQVAILSRASFVDRADQASRNVLSTLAERMDWTYRALPRLSRPTLLVC